MELKYKLTNCENNYDEILEIFKKIQIILY